MEEELGVLIDQIDRHFSRTEFEELCLSLDLSADNLAGDTKLAKIRELIGYLKRREGLPRLYASIQAARPDVRWSGVLPRTLNVPIVVAAMTRDEAEQLAQSADPHVASVLQGLALLWQNYAASYLPGWLEYYSTRQEWRPLFGSGQTILDIIWNVAELLDERRAAAKPMAPVIFPHFRTDDFFSTERLVRGKVDAELRDTGALVIVDPISLYHPTVANRLLQSGLAGNERAAFLIASPFNLRAISIHTVIESRIEVTLERIYARFHDELDDLCEYGVSDVLTLQRWLYSRFDNAEGQFRNPALPGERRMELRRLMGQDPAPSAPGAIWPHLGSPA